LGKWGQGSPTPFLFSVKEIITKLHRNQSCSLTHPVVAFLRISVSTKVVYFRIFEGMTF
jgi:hypothetical protein